MPTSTSERSQRPLLVRVRFHGALGARWLATLQNATLTSTPQGSVTETTLVAEVPDEAALIGLLNMLYNLGCTLITVESVGEGGAAGGHTAPSP